MLQDFELLQLVAPLQEWFAKNARLMPWREDPTPYHVWISEIMLQQTRVEAVRPYYARFMEALPDVEALASCEEDRYLKLWEGLGYYSRVRNLHEAAVQIMTEHGGVIPSDYEDLRKLKGIGDYTAGAISSLAYGKAVPAVDGNVMRVIARVTGDDTDIMDAGFRKRVQHCLQELMRRCTSEETAENSSEYSMGAASEYSMGAPASEKPELPRLVPRLFNQGLMELGALVCLPNGEPHCEECPWQQLCVARREGRTAELPVRSRAKARKIVPRTILILREGSRLAIRKRPARGLLAGLYELPGVEGHLSEEEALAFVKQMGYNALQIKALPPAKHVFSHVEWHMIGYMIRVEEDAFSTEEQKEMAAKERLLYLDMEEVRAHYAIPSAFEAYTKEVL